MGGTSSSESAAIMGRPKRPVTCLTTRASVLQLAHYFFSGIHARKPHYMADILQALCWGLICGFEVLLPYWYVCFFVPMIIHRAVRDDAR